MHGNGVMGMMFFKDDVLRLAFFMGHDNQAALFSFWPLLAVSLSCELVVRVKSPCSLFPTLIEDISKYVGFFSEVREAEI